eukprot:IDg19568t1
MRVTDFSIGKARERQRRASHCFLSALRTSNSALKVISMRASKDATEDMVEIARRTQHICSATFNLNRFSEQQCLIDFRFKRSEIPRIAALCGWTGRTERNGYICDPVTATCVMLRRLAYPCRWRDLEKDFGMHSSKLSEVFWEVSESLHATRGHLVTSFRKDLFEGRAHLYAEAVRDNGGGLENCVGFIDGTKIQMCRPGGADANQRANYSGHKRFHGLTYQTVTVPDGLIIHLYGPVEGRQPDSVMYCRSGMEHFLQENFIIDGVQYCIYGDAAYMLRAWLITAYPRHTATAAQASFNKEMNAVRTAVEWSYGEVKQSFTSQDFPRNLKLRQAPISLLYICAVLLRNFRTCLGHGGQTVHYFECTPPSLENYISF